MPKERLSKAICGRVGCHFQEMESGESSRMRTLAGEQLLKQLPTLQRLQQRLMDCKPSGAAAHDPVVQAALMAVLKESFKVYKAVSEGIINLADRFFEMEYLDAQKGLEIYKESIVDNTRLQVAWNSYTKPMNTNSPSAELCSASLFACKRQAWAAELMQPLQQMS